MQIHPIRPTTHQSKRQHIRGNEDLVVRVVGGFVAFEEAAAGAAAEEVDAMGELMLTH